MILEPIQGRRQGVLLREGKMPRNCRRQPRKLSGGGGGGGGTLTHLLSSTSKIIQIIIIMG